MDYQNQKVQEKTRKSDGESHSLLIADDFNLNRKFINPLKSRFVIHEHHATRLHFDLRLEIGGVLKSWAVPKGVSMNPSEKRLAIAVPDHSIGYINFEGTLAEGSYGAGEVRVWDKGEFETDGDAEEQLRRGKLVFTFGGAKLKGEFTLLKMWNQEKNWLIIKSRDEFADKEWKLKTVLTPKK